MTDDRPGRMPGLFHYIGKSFELSYIIKPSGGCTQCAEESCFAAALCSNIRKIRPMK